MISLPGIVAYVLGLGGLALAVGLLLLSGGCLLYRWKRGRPSPTGIAAAIAVGSLCLSCLSGVMVWITAYNVVDGDVVDDWTFVWAAANVLLSLVAAITYFLLARADRIGPRTSVTMLR